MTRDLNATGRWLKRLKQGLTAEPQDRKELVGVLRSLTADEWLRSGEHEQLGTLTVADICQKIIEHEAEHRAQLDRIVAGGREA